MTTNDDKGDKWQIMSLIMIDDNDARRHWKKWWRHDDLTITVIDTASLWGLLMWRQDKVALLWDNVFNKIELNYLLGSVVVFYFSGNRQLCKTKLP